MQTFFQQTKFFFSNNYFSTKFFLSTKFCLDPPFVSRSHPETGGDGGLALGRWQSVTIKRVLVTRMAAKGYTVTDGAVGGVAVICCTGRSCTDASPTPPPRPWVYLCSNVRSAVFFWCVL